ncbi:hypothetical protein ACFQPF_13005 [Fictibacillus iocasae]|uniref:Uncharacterized protein n=1 Tax=Fictibacillus iocasae TaxID=2715437 RepID=A0ABW2NQ40_9BACL
MTITKERLLSALNDYIDMQRDDTDDGNPSVIRKKELETYLETSADKLQIPYTKESTSTQTYYQFQLENTSLKLEINYRYKNYYTRHTLTAENAR